MTTRAIWSKAFNKRSVVGLSVARVACPGNKPVKVRCGEAGGAHDQHPLVPTAQGAVGWLMALRAAELVAFASGAVILRAQAG